MSGCSLVSTTHTNAGPCNIEFFVASLDVRNVFYSGGKSGNGIFVTTFLRS
jgi:hypothetical protein